MLYNFGSVSHTSDSPISIYDAAAAAGIISREILVARVNGELRDLTYIPDGDCEVKLLTFDDPDDDGARRTFRHTASHILAEAVKRLYPAAKLTIGPAIDDGFYYDFDSDVAFTPEILKEIEGEMKKIVRESQRLERFTLSREEAKKLMSERGEDYKLLLIDRVPEGEEISFYKMGDFVDLCAGPHLFTTAIVKAFKLTQCTGAYWEGKSENKMLQRIYGTAFPTKDAMNEFLAKQEEARSRDHNKLGRELELFTTVDAIGQGLPILLPKGARIIQRLQRWIEDEEEKRGYLLTKTPLMAKRDLYKISGHWDHYLDGMFILGDPYDETKECFALRPMTCPFQYQAYLTKKRSYRELPLRYGETSTLFRNEDS
ncbi:MAG: threonine--tRNA ligase, partial [Clostridia bacterium]|nr:threonine--tRNA ligase [Clostridia bacterium]